MSQTLIAKDEVEQIPPIQFNVQNFSKYYTITLR